MTAALKGLVAATWLAALACLLLPGDGLLLRGGRVLFWTLLAVHLVECAVFLPALRRSGRPLPGELLQVLLFGVIRYGEVQQERTESGGERP